MAGETDRTIRVFVSSTFRDMQEEREELVKRIFPQLRRMCEERGVTWGEVDLRWGIPDEQKAEGKVLPICLAEIERCRPYFIGLLGERYGSLPDETPDELIAEQPWLAEHREHSVTALEIMHGVLNNPKMADRALFYFRDPAYLDHLPAGADPSDFRAEDDAARTKVAALKDRIRAGKLRYPPREGYSDPQALGKLVFEDLTSIIEELYPEDERPDPLDREAAEHEAFAQSRTRVYIGGEKYFPRLDEHVAGDGPPLVVLGESGVGKSALLANWSIRYREQHPDELVIMHFIGASPYSADWAAMVRRLLGEFQRKLGVEREIPAQPEDLRGALDDWLPYVAATGRVVLILDGLNQLEDRDRAQELVWLPRVLPPNVRLILSTLPGKTLEGLERRGWPTTTVALLKPDERLEVVRRYLEQYRKTLSAHYELRIAEAEQTANPMYLCVLLEELRLFGEHRLLEQQIERYLSARDCVELYDAVLERWEEDYERDRPGLVRDAMTCIWAARFGLTEADLLDLLGTGEEPLPRAYWSPLYLATEQALVQRSGRLAFFHDFLREAVRRRWLREEEAQRAIHGQLAARFAYAPADRWLDEYPHQLRQAEQWDTLAAVLSDVDALQLAWDKGRKYEWVGYWHSVRDRFDPVRCYQATIEIKAQAEGETASVAGASSCISWLLMDMGLYEAAVPFSKRALGIRRRAIGPEDLLLGVSLTGLAEIYVKQGNYAAAQPLYEEALVILERTAGHDHSEVATALNGLAIVYQEQGRFLEALDLRRREVVVREGALGPDHPFLATDLCNLAALHRIQGRYAEALPLAQRAVEIWERALGPHSPDFAQGLNHLGVLLDALGKPEEARAAHEGASRILEDVLGEAHPLFATSMNNLGMFELNCADYAKAALLFERALGIHERALGPDHPLVALSANNLAVALREQGKTAEALPLYRRALDTYRRALGPDHRDTIASLSGLAVVLYDRGEYEEAEPLYRQALEIQEKVLGPQHPWVAVILNNLGALLKSKGDYQEAESMYRRALAIREKALGPEHSDTAVSLNNLGQLLYVKGDCDQAEALLCRALAAWQKALGSDHPYTRRAQDALETIRGKGR